MHHKKSVSTSDPTITGLLECIDRLLEDGVPRTATIGTVRSWLHDDPAERGTEPPRGTLSIEAFWTTEITENPPA